MVEMTEMVQLEKKKVFKGGMAIVAERFSCI